MRKYQLCMRLLILSTISFYSCYTLSPDPYIVSELRQRENIYYAPATQNAPLLSKKSEGSFSLGLGVTPKLAGADLNVAFSPVKKIGITAGVRSYNSKNRNGETKIDSHEFGAGYLKDLSGLWHFEIYGGLGSGRVRNLHYTGNSEIRFNNYFLQPAIAVQDKNKTVQFALVSRFSQLNFRANAASFNYDREPFVAAQFKSISNEPNHFFWEPGLLFRAGWDSFVFQFGFSTSFDFSSNDFYRDKINASFGIIFRGNLGKTQAIKK
jgi:hypothetical protein